MSDSVNVVAVRLGPPPDSADRIVADGSIAHAVEVPVLVDFDFRRRIGVATVRPDGSGELRLDAGVRLADDERVTIGFRVVESHTEGDVTVVDKMDVMCLGVVKARRQE